MKGLKKKSVVEGGKGREKKKGRKEGERKQKKKIESKDIEKNNRLTCVKQVKLECGNGVH